MMFYYSIYYFSKQRHERLWGYIRGSSNTKKAGKARSYGLYRHLRRNKEIIKNLFRYYFKRKRDDLIEELTKGENKGLSFHFPEGGLFVWCALDDKINEKKLFNICREKGLLIMPGYIFYPDGYQGGGHIRLCFSKLDKKDIKKAVAILNEAIALILEQNEAV